MYKKKINILIVLIFVFCLVFMVLGAFDSVKIITTSTHTDVLPSSTETKAIDKMFFVTLIIGCVQAITTLFKNRFVRVVSLLCAVFGFVFSMRIPMYAVLIESVYDSMTGCLASTDYVVTILGYTYIFIAIFILVLQIVLSVLLYKQRKELLFQENICETYNNDI